MEFDCEKITPTKTAKGKAMKKIVFESFWERWFMGFFKKIFLIRFDILN